MKNKNIYIYIIYNTYIVKVSGNKSSYILKKDVTKWVEYLTIYETTKGLQFTYQNSILCKPEA